MAKSTEHDAHMMAIRAADECHRLFDVLQARARQAPPLKTGTKIQQAEAAAYYQRSFGTKFAARFLRSRGWSFEQAMGVLSIRSDGK
jgi:hypothetical protein